MAARTLNELRRQITAALNETLRKEVVDVVKKTEQKHVQQDVYDAYKPKRYDRREEDGGLKDPRNMVVTEYELGVDIDNKTSFNGGYDNMRSKWYVPPPNYGNELEYLVEYGEGGHETYHYNYHYSRMYMQPRPFIHNTVDELKQGVLRQTLIEGLRARGIQAE